VAFAPYVPHHDVTQTDKRADRFRALQRSA